ncbi:hypothetical protein ABFB09_01005 [Dehalogenimonas sp. THU2]|uniref:hypothetical protein n=1 Tax=Dehalogenimonas sp. THU2 TaxID=3151121 RepID=UPI0032183678
MEPMVAPVVVDRMFETSEPRFVDPDTNRCFVMVVLCPNDGERSYIETYKKSGQSLTTVTFKCPACERCFEVSREHIMVI